MADGLNSNAFKLGARSLHLQDMQVSTWYKVFFHNYAIGQNNTFEAAGAGTVSANANDNLNYITMFVRNVNLPEVTFDPIEVPYGNSMFRLAGKIQYNENQLTLNDSIDSETVELIQRWQDLILNPENESMGYASEYKKIMSVWEFGPKGPQSGYRSYDFYGAWPSNITYGEMQSDGSDLVQIQLTITYDYYDINKQHYERKPQGERHPVIPENGSM